MRKNKLPKNKIKNTFNTAPIKILNTNKLMLLLNSILLMQLSLNITLNIKKANINNNNSLNNLPGKNTSK
jgi:hypothetical protein